MRPKGTIVLLAVLLSTPTVVAQDFNFGLDAFARVATPEGLDLSSIGVRKASALKAAREGLVSAPDTNLLRIGVHAVGLVAADLDAITGTGATYLALIQWRDLTDPRILRRSFQNRLTYVRVSPELALPLDRWNLNSRYGFRLDRRWYLGFVADATELRKVSFDLQGRFAASYSMRSDDKLKAVANVGWGHSDQDFLEDQSDIVAALGLLFTFGKKPVVAECCNAPCCAPACCATKQWDLSVDYAFDDDVNGDDNISLTLTRTIAAGIGIVTANDEGDVILSVGFVFR